ncbi:MAG: hypothetical protein LBR28_00525 [Bacteroidales bacterium]|jgi:hypothetical protein|nr:hypothetical protein [Bacteroidales bacterium]
MKKFIMCAFLLAFMGTTVVIAQNPPVKQEAKTEKKACCDKKGDEKSKTCDHSQKQCCKKDVTKQGDASAKQCCKKEGQTSEKKCCKKDATKACCKDKTKSQAEKN